MTKFDFNQIERDCDELITNDLEYLIPVGVNDAFKVKGLITRLRQAEKDAARYRWLRDEADGFQIDGCMQLRGEEWDNKIDKVMNVSNN